MEQVKFGESFWEHSLATGCLNLLSIQKKACPCPQDTPPVQLGDKTPEDTCREKEVCHPRALPRWHLKQTSVSLGGDWSKVMALLSVSENRFQVSLGQAM